MLSSSVTQPSQQLGGLYPKSRVTWSLSDAQQQLEDEQLSAPTVDSGSDVVREPRVACTGHQPCSDAAPTNCSSTEDDAAQQNSSLCNITLLGGPNEALLSEVSWCASAAASKHTAAHVAAGKGPEATPAPKPPPAPAAAACPVAHQPMTLAAAPAASAVPPLKLLQALPLSAVPAAAPAAAPTQLPRASYQLTDSLGSRLLVCLADVDGGCAQPNSAAAATTGLPLQAAAEQQPWTQNTARALRRTQQEVAELCVAGGLPLPAERAYCFDLVGTLVSCEHQI